MEKKENVRDFDTQERGKDENPTALELCVMKFKQWARLNEL